MQQNSENLSPLKYNPVSSYRIQFSKSFTLNDLEKQIDYIDKLGVVSIYASPVFAAVPGSNHGYDVTGPGIINPELGTFEDFSRLVRLLKERNIGWIQDIVPNHMAYNPANPWIWDVLEKGPCSENFSVFDLEPSVVEGTDKIMLPFLGNTPEKIIENGELQLIAHRGSVALKYYDDIYPVNFQTFMSLFSPYMESAPGEFSQILEKYSLDTGEINRKFLYGKWEPAKKEIDDLLNTSETIRSFLNTVITGINNNTAMLGNIVADQHYEICHWRETSQRINYRRFFTINDLICIRIEDPAVFEKHHRFIKELLEGGHVDGLRADHIDGLYDPGQYLRNLRGLAGENTYVIVEKILEHGEKIPPVWPVQGTSGYDYLALVNNLLTSGKDYRRLLGLYRNITGEAADPDDIVYNNKKLILESNMQGELDNLFSLLEKLMDNASEKGIAAFNEKKGVTPGTMRQALAQLMLSFPVYRLYPAEFPLDSVQREIFGNIFNEAQKRNQGIKNALGTLRDLMLASRTDDDLYNNSLESFCLRLMQFTGPLTAKGVEDTSMYQYNCFISHNEVGGSIDSRGISGENFHRAMIDRQAQSPLSMNATSTHDTKRGEDVRARLNAIGEMAGEWEQLVKKWTGMNGDLRTVYGTRQMAPTPNEEYLIYQTIAGTFPFDENADERYIQRVVEYLVKAMREAKQNSSWDDPDELHEKAVCDFARSMLDPGNAFLKSFIPFHQKLVWRGIVNSLVQLTIKCCSPGMPDIYRGTELWDLSLVDPDNRRPVDFSHLHDMLDNTLRKWKANPPETVGDLYKKAFDGRIKQLITYLLLNERKTSPSLFHHGDYIPLETSGKFKNNVFGFIRNLGDSWLMCVLPLHTGGLSSRNRGEYLSSVNWKGTTINTPAGAPENWENILTGETLQNQAELDAGKLLGDLPVAVFRGKQELSARRSGMLLHISSLPGRYGIGDFGPEAYRFVDFLSATRQTYWQTLPLSPVTKTQSWSPYSSPSAFAGSILLISPWQLYADGLINYSDLELTGFRSSNRVNHAKASGFREMLLEKAWERFRKDSSHYLQREFERFCRKESHWLEDYTLFLAFKQRFGNKDWSRWPARVTNRDRKTLKTAGYEYSGIIRLEKFKQFMFDRQWKKLKEYANNKGILIFGDIPYYVSFDSAEVWANQHLFNLKDNGKMKTVAGVPPDYFDKNGQLWNMPVFVWDRLKVTGYDWWMKRLAKNLELFDLLRLDHFRAFSAFWEVPAKEKIAVHGKWSPGPGSDFFKVLELNFPAMPFVAEDLGDIDQPVYDLRDEFFLPGMQVLQFSFDRNMARNIHTPHNHSLNSVVYTGTHDNNTLMGWYEQELGREGRKRLSEYADKNIRKSGSHWELIKMAFASPARISIIPMQDYLGLGRNARMNTPSTSRGNWIWKMKDQVIDKTISDRITRFTVMYNRK